MPSTFSTITPNASKKMLKKKICSIGRHSHRTSPDNVKKLHVPNGTMALLFQDEPDEDEGPSLFQRESELGEGMFPLQDEPDETEPCNAAAVGIHHVPPQLFQDEVDEASDAASDSSGFFGDCETDAHHGSRQELVQLSFATLTKFLETQLCNVSAKKNEPMVKKRRHNNQVRAAKAAANKHISTPKRVPRNDPES